MKKTLRTVFAASLMALSLASCGSSISQKYADKINDAASSSSEKDDLTYDQVVKALGKDFSGVVLNNSTGVATWSVTKGNTTKTIVVTFAGGKATGAVYAETTEEKK